MASRERNLGLEEYVAVSPLRGGFEGTFTRIAHEQRYQWLRGSGRALGRVLEVGGGLGFALPSLASACQLLIEVDFNHAVVRRAAETSPPGVHFAVADCRAAPFRDGGFDSVIAFEIIEHVDRPDELVRELARLVRRDGTVYLSTPNRLERERKGRAMFELHAREYAPGELYDVLAARFRSVQVVGQRYVHPAVTRVQAHPRLRGLLRSLQALVPRAWRDALLRRMFPPSAIAASWQISGDDLERCDTLLATCVP